MARKKIVAGNWKMNMTPSQAVKLVEELKPLVVSDDVEVVYCVPAIDIVPVVEAVKGTNVAVGAENMYFEEKGAYTGEISAEMLVDAGVKYVVLGHSERRDYFKEDDVLLNKKVKKAFEKGLTPILCCGETLEQREMGITLDWIRKQVKIAFQNVTADQAKVLEEIGFADGILFGTPTIVGEALKPIWDLTTSIFAGTHGGKLASAFGSYGWSGEGVPHIMERLKQLRMNTVDGLRIRFRPGDTELVEAFEYGYHFGSLLQDKKAEKTTKGSRKLVKCLVCGEIFDSSLEVCPVCGVGRENFVPVEEKETTYRKDGDEFYVILGNGTAGLNAAKAVRERDKTSSILMISEEKYPTYNRPMLTKALNAGLEISQIQVEPESWYEENQVYQILGKKIISVDKTEKEVTLEDGMRLKYTKLIYALGAKSFVPPIPGSEKEQVAVIRTLEDAEKIGQMIPKNGQTVVIGGGVLGLEAAWELKKAGCQVTVLEAASVLMGRQLDEGAAAMLGSIGESVGIKVRTGVKIDRIEGQERVTAVRLADGEEIAANLVLISCGVRANTELAEQMGLKVNRAVAVNEKMQTSEKDIYACGDCVEFEGENAALWAEASEQGKVAGANAAGECVEYQKVQMPLSFNGMNTSLYAIGDNGRNKNLLYKTLEICDRSKKQYEKLYFLNGKLCGVILIGNVSKMAKLTKLMERKATFAEVILDKETESY